MPSRRSLLEKAHKASLLADDSPPKCIPQPSSRPCLQAHRKRTPRRLWRCLWGFILRIVKVWAPSWTPCTWRILFCLLLLEKLTTNVPRSVTTSETIWSVMFTLDMNGKRRHKPPWIIATSVGMLVSKLCCNKTTHIADWFQADHSMQSCLLWQIFVKLAVARTKTANATVVVSVTSCICAWHPQTWSSNFVMAKGWIGSWTPRRLVREVVAGSLLREKRDADGVAVLVGGEEILVKIGGLGSNVVVLCPR